MNMPLVPRLLAQLRGSKRPKGSSDGATEGRMGRFAARLFVERIVQSDFRTPPFVASSLRRFVATRATF
jgi:hypothetical protein